MKLCHKLCVLRGRMGWSQEVLAERMDVSRQTISRWESGRALPDANRILRLSRLFGVTADLLLDDTLTLEGVPDPLPAESAEDGPPRITEEDSYRFIARCQRDAWKDALACACLPLSFSIMFLGLGLDSFLSVDGEGVFFTMGVMMWPLLVMMALCQLLCSLLSRSERRLNEGKPCDIEPGALFWAVEACEYYQVVSQPQRRTAFALLAAALPVSFAFISISEEATMELFTGLASSVSLAMVAVAVYLLVRTSRIRRCYQRLARQAEVIETEFVPESANSTNS